MKTVLLLSFSLIMLTACGQKGALYLPKKPTNPPTQTTEPEVSTNPNDY
ncbi:LPS translocon maturation chaperone LptM [Moraxella oblonga]|nr:lipoprotein [Moraxella oblonga]